MTTSRLRVRTPIFVPPENPSTMHLNLAEKNPSRLLSTLQNALAEKPKTLNIELIGPGALCHDTALMLHEEIRKRPPGTRIHVRARTCLMDGAILLWLAADTRSMRDDTWIQISELPDENPFCGSEHYPNSIRVSEEAPSQTDFRTLLRYIGEYLPVHEIAGFRLFEPHLRELGVLNDDKSPDLLARLFNPEPPEGDDAAREAATTRAKQKK
jgi:hypothetical protein